MIGVLDEDSQQKHDLRIDEEDEDDPDQIVLMGDSRSEERIGDGLNVANTVSMEVSSEGGAQGITSHEQNLQNNDELIVRNLVTIAGSEIQPGSERSSNSSRSAQAV